MPNRLFVSRKDLLFAPGYSSRPGALFAFVQGARMSDERKGAEFMALRLNVMKKRREIRRDLTPSQNYLLDDIVEGTVYKWTTENKFDLDDLANGLGYKSRDKVYLLLKQLQKEQIIIRKPTKYRGLEVLGLNPKFFGQILIDHQHNLEKKRHLELVVDKFEEELTNPKLATYESNVEDLRIVSSKHTNHKPNDNQIDEIISEKLLLDSYKASKSLRLGNSDESEWDEEGPRKAREILEKISGSLKGMPR